VEETMNDFITVNHKGKMVLAVPWLNVEDYLSVPRWTRWIAYLVAAIENEVLVSLYEGDLKVRFEEV
jgi:hypothetical protein